MYTNNNKESRSNSEYWTKKNELAKKAKLHTEKMKEKECLYCTWGCPGWMCMNKEHPDFDLDDDCPITVNLDDCCKLFCLGDNDYKRFLKEK